MAVYSGISLFWVGKVSWSECMRVHAWTAGRCICIGMSYSLSVCDLLAMDFGIQVLSSAND